MSTIAQRVVVAADYEAQRLTHQIDSLKMELQRKQTELDEINRKLETATLAALRRKAFIVADGAKYFCPRCDFHYRRETVLAFKPGDIIECNTCGLSV